ncbi:hypothetical protein QBC34DRAFT_108796 [Podospora aff. communis PSN243]|uniref:Uncharacterized protein n=1 Tax=Podospora aff. communis PSN243 TaxID=3040156 RepID=A0AAV9H5I9_9PEZI|nr:hypothetical protein QBC34DRAFT_108796 [Podospora aff. communis PSN243]
MSLTIVRTKAQRGYESGQWGVALSQPIFPFDSRSQSSEWRERTRSMPIPSLFCLPWGSGPSSRRMHAGVGPGRQRCWCWRVASPSHLVRAVGCSATGKETSGGERRAKTATLRRECRDCNAAGSVALRIGACRRPAAAPWFAKGSPKVRRCRGSEKAIPRNRVGVSREDNVMVICNPVFRRPRLAAKKRHNKETSASALYLHAFTAVRELHSRIRSPFGRTNTHLSFGLNHARSTRKERAMRS